MLLLVLWLAACVPGQVSRPTATNPVLRTSTPTRTVQPSDTASPSPQPTETDTPDPLTTPFITPKNTNAPLRFVFPSQAARPISAWRPPLYPVPWALSPYDHFLFTRPIAADEVNWPQADYRYGALWRGLNNVFHTGIDIEAPAGTPVLAAAAGKVVWAGEGLMYGPGIPNDPYGLAVAISHDFGYEGKIIQTIYAHMSKILVVPGQRVNSGDVLGRVGDTGLTTGPHLHFEVRIEDTDFYTTRNPELWLAPPQGWGVLVGRLTDGMGNKLHDQEIRVKSDQNGQVWIVNTYATDEMVVSDAYYRENLVLSDLPAGSYTISLVYQEVPFKQVIQINPGMVSYFAFMGFYKFSTSLPPTPYPDFVMTATKTP